MPRNLGDHPTLALRSTRPAPWVSWAIVLLFALPALPGAAAGAAALAPPQPGLHLRAPPSLGLAGLLNGPVVPRTHPSFQVDPYSYYSAEPAPMGIADFGVDPATDTGYTYNTTEFLGSANISSLTVLNDSNTGAIDQMSIQLNVVLVVNGSGGTFTYWIQDVAFLNTTSDLIQFIDNVWNMTSYGAYTTGNDITGNGTGYYGWYYDIASSYLTGNDVVLSYPATVQLRVISSIVGGYPAVAFEYNDTGSWVTYDNIIVAFGHGYSSEGFVVDGTSYNSYGLFNDAELILGGPGGGSQTTDTGSKMGLTLEYWNGHNLQPVINAYNFGSDTAEGIDHVVDRVEWVPSDGTLFGEVAKGTSRGLGTLYDHSFDAILNVSAPLGSGTLLLNGTVVASYIGGDANLTVAPGNYDLSLDTTTGALYGTEPIVVPAGAYVPIAFGVSGSYPVTIKETGLPTGTPWSVTIGPNLSRSAGTVINLLERNGTYPYTVTPIPGWTATPWSGNFTVAGKAVTVGISWTRVTYPITFTETGLPAGTFWQVVVGGAGINGRTATLQIDEPNGTYAYQVDGIAGYTATPASGSVPVNGAGQSYSIAWGIAKFDLTFLEQGLPSGTVWTVNVEGAPNEVFTPSFRVSVPNGTYPYQLGLVPGFFTSQPSGTAVIDGRAVQVEFNFTAFRTPVNFTETGLPSGTNWSVSVAGLSTSGTGRSFVLDLLNGTYEATVAARAPYALSIANVSVAVHGAPIEVPVPFAPLPGWLTGSVAPDGATVTVNGTVLTLSSGAFNLTLPIGNYTLVVTLSGYQTVTREVSIAPGEATSISLTLNPLPVTHTGNGTQPVHLSGSGGIQTWGLWAAVAAATIAVVAVVAYAISRRRRTLPTAPEEPPAE